MPALPRLSLLLLLAAPLLAGRTQTPPPGEVDAAIDRGMEWLLSHQHLDGTLDYHREPRVGLNALVAYTLLKSGLSPKHHALQRLFVHLEHVETDRTYDTALLILAFATHGDARYRARIQELADRLVDWQKSAGFGYPGGPGDLSNTQYAALGLRAAARAGADVPERSWYELIEATLRHRDDDGGFGYRQGSHATGSMTAAGVGVLAICRDRLDLGEGRSGRRRAREVEEAIEGGLAWLARRFTVSQNPGHGRTHLGYYLYGLERVGALVPTDRIGEHDWYAMGAEFLVRSQARQGHWAGSLGGGHEETCFALLFLRRATRPVTGGLHRRAGRRYVVDEQAEVHIAAAGDNPLGMWVVGFGPEAREKLSWPEELGAGMRVARVVWFVDDVEVRRVSGEEERATGQERYEHEVEFEQPGEHTVRAEAHVLRPPRRDASGRTYPASLAVLGSAQLEVDVENACPAWMLRNARDRSRNRMPAGRPTVRASSSRHGHGAAHAVDEHQARSWLSEPDDLRPTLWIELQEPQRADRVVIGHARGTPVVPGRWARAVVVEVHVNGGERHRLRMHSDERRKGRLELPHPVLVRELKLVVPFAAPGRNEETSVGFAEVELQLSGS